MSLPKARPRVLVVIPFVPLPVVGGGGGTYYGMIRSLACEFEIDLACFSDVRFGESQLEGLRSVCSRLVVYNKAKRECYLAGLGGLISGLPLRVGYCRDGRFRRILHSLVAQRRHDLAIASHERMAQYVAELPVATRVWDIVDVACVRQKMIAHASTKVLQRLVSAIDFFLIRAFERSSLEAFAETWVCTDLELLELRRFTGRGCARVSRRGVSADFAPAAGTTRERGTVMFMGQLGYEPNADGLKWLAELIWPAVLSGYPNARLMVVGPSPPRWLLDRARVDRSIIATGPVESVEPYLQRAAVLVCPLRIGTGVRIKILEAMAAGCPVVSTTTGYRGIAAQPGRDLVTADTPGSFANAVVRLLSEPDQGIALAASARQNVTPLYSSQAVANGVAVRIRHLLNRDK